jgi:hypothetical protein
MPACRDSLEYERVPGVYRLASPKSLVQITTRTYFGYTPGSVRFVSSTAMQRSPLVGYGCEVYSSSSGR